MEIKMKKIAILCAVTLISFFILGFLPVHGEEKIYDSVIRLHVLANSDSEEDQALKLLVRDAVLLKAQELLSNTQSKEGAEAIISHSLESLRQAAEEAVRENGYSYSVSVTLGKEDYPTKSYESCALPSGEYTSLQILIGEASGKNWWCVLFPPLCLSAATDKDAFTSVGITDSQYQIITESDKPKYKIKFKILESFSEIVN